MERQSHLEIKVGGFVLVGLLVIGVLVVAFGQFSQFFQRTYEVRAKFENASGILKNSHVLFRGAKIGKVKTRPEIVDEGKGIILSLGIVEGVNIPKNSRFKIGSHGLLGDRFVDVIPSDEPSQDMLKDGDVVDGMKSAGFSELADDAKPVVERIDRIVHRLDSEVLTDETLGDIRQGVASAKSLLKRLDALTKDAQEGKGALNTLLKDPQVAGDIKTAIREFRTLSTNLRKHGVLFYEDPSGEEEAGKNEERQEPNWSSKSRR